MLFSRPDRERKEQSLPAGTAFFFEKLLDISAQMAYNKREEGIPVDGLLPIQVKK